MTIRATSEEPLLSQMSEDVDPGRGPRALRSSGLDAFERNAYTVRLDS